jgi:hypothetical protein
VCAGSTTISFDPYHWHLYASMVRMIRGETSSSDRFLFAFFLTKVPRRFDRASAGLGHLLNLQVLDDDAAVVFDDHRGRLLRRVPPATGVSGLQPGHSTFCFFSVHGLVTDSRNCQSEKQTWQSEALGPYVGATQRCAASFLSGSGRLVSRRRYRKEYSAMTDYNPRRLAW